MPYFRKRSDIKSGVVGFGGAHGMGRYHVEHLRAAGVAPIAMVDPDPQRLSAAQQDFPELERYRSVTDMLSRSEVNLVVIVTPHNTHAKLAIQCMKAGRHVITEKPFAITTSECDRMIAEAKRRRVMLSTYHNRHWDSDPVDAVRQIRRGVIGQVVGVELNMCQYAPPDNSWRGSKSISGGILYDWGAHILEWGLQLIDSPMVEVTGFATRGFWAAKTKWKNDTIEDEVHAVVRFKSGQRLSLCISQISIDSPPKLVVKGTKGNYVAGKIIRQKGNQTITSTHRLPPRHPERYYQNVVAHLTKGTPLVITAQWARRPIHIMDLANRSAILGRSLRARYG